MILPIHIYGSKILSEKARDITPDFENLQQTIENMYETMYAADGIGLAAVQVGIDANLFIIDVSEFFEGDEAEEIAPEFCGEPFKRTFINARIANSSANTAPYTEGCLSVPGINASVVRPEWVEIEYLDENFKPQSCKFGGIMARAIQHEMDHLQGKVFVERTAPLRRQILRTKLMAMSRGDYRASYRTIIK